MRAGGIDVTMQEDGVPRALDSTLELGLFRVAQQSLTNALRHAGAAHVTMDLRWLENHVELRVADDGAGIELRRNVWQFDQQDDNSARFFQIPLRLAWAST
mgnify:CR=1 FL=1